MSDAIAKRLRQARKEKFPTAREAAESLGVAYQTYAAHENGNRAFDNEAAAKYARRYHVSLDWLLTGNGSRNPPASSLDQIVADLQAIYGDEEANALRDKLKREAAEWKALLDRRASR